MSPANKTVQATAGTPADLWMRQVPPCLTLIVSRRRTGDHYGRIFSSRYKEH